MDFHLMFLMINRPKPGGFVFVFIFNPSPPFTELTRKFAVIDEASNSYMTT